MPFSIQKTDTENSLVLEGELTIMEARDLSAAMVQLASDDRPVGVDASGVRGLHTAILQALISLKMTCARFRLRNPSPEFTAAAARLGLADNYFDA